MIRPAGMDFQWVCAARDGCACAALLFNQPRTHVDALVCVCVAEWCWGLWPMRPIEAACVLCALVFLSPSPVCPLGLPSCPSIPWARIRGAALLACAAPRPRPHDIARSKARPCPHGTPPRGAAPLDASAAPCPLRITCTLHAATPAIPCAIGLRVAAPLNSCGLERVHSTAKRRSCRHLPYWEFKAAPTGLKVRAHTGPFPQHPAGVVEL